MDLSPLTDGPVLLDQKLFSEVGILAWMVILGLGFFPDTDSDSLEGQGQMWLC